MRQWLKRRRQIFFETSEKWLYALFLGWILVILEGAREGYSRVLLVPKEISISSMVRLLINLPKIYYAIVLVTIFSLYLIAKNYRKYKAIRRRFRIIEGILWDVKLRARCIKHETRLVEKFDGWHSKTFYCPDCRDGYLYRFSEHDYNILLDKVIDAFAENS
jgi:hypothetical protein